MQGRNGDAGVENGLVDAVGEEKGQREKVASAYICILSGFKMDS